MIDVVIAIGATTFLDDETEVLNLLVRLDLLQLLLPLVHLVVLREVSQVEAAQVVFLSRRLFGASKVSVLLFYQGAYYLVLYQHQTLFVVFLRLYRG